MKKHDRILDGLARAASRQLPPHVAEMPPGLATRVLTEVRTQARASEERWPNFGGVLERWLVGALPAAVVITGVMWVTGAQQPAPARATIDAESRLADKLFEEALRP